MRKERRCTASKRHVPSSLAHCSNPQLPKITVPLHRACNPRKLNLLIRSGDKSPKTSHRFQMAHDSHRQLPGRWRPRRPPSKHHPLSILLFLSSIIVFSLHYYTIRVAPPTSRRGLFTACVILVFSIRRLTVVVVASVQLLRNMRVSAFP
jgi:hypothetical protein